MKPALASCWTTMYSEPGLNLMLRASSCSRRVRPSSYGCMGCRDRYVSTASASRLLTLRCRAMCSSGDVDRRPDRGTVPTANPLGEQVAAGTAGRAEDRDPHWRAPQGSLVDIY